MAEINQNSDLSTPPPGPNSLLELGQFPTLWVLASKFIDGWCQRAQTQRNGEAWESSPVQTCYLATPRSCFYYVSFT